MPGRNSFSTNNGEKHFGAANTRRAIVVAAAAAAALVVMLFCTRSSFLFPMNNWDDANSYFTMGKSMMHGILIYRDIFDQKGPWLYFLYGLCSLVSRTTFAGVFLMEIAFGALDLLAAYRIFRLRLGEAASLALMAPSLAVMCATRSFYWGGSAEELCLPAILWTLYLVMRQLLGEKRSGLPAPFSYSVIFAAGLMSGYVAGIKFTILGFFFAFMVLVMFLSRSVKRFLISCAVFLAGMFLPFVPWLIYFGVRGALADWYRVYIYANVFLYSTFGAADKGESLYDKVYNLSKILYWLFRVNLPYFLMTGAGMFWMLLRKGADLVSRFALILMFGLTFVGIFIARMSKGRTIREFVAGVVAVPAIGSIIWFAIFGSMGITLGANGTITSEQMSEIAGAPEVGLYVVLQQYPIGMIVCIIATVLLCTFFITSGNSGTFVLSMLSTHGALNPPKGRMFFWGIVQSVMAVGMLLAGGLKPLQTVSIAAAFPFIFIMIACMVSLVKGLKADEREKSQRETKTG